MVVSSLSSAIETIGAAIIFGLFFVVPALIGLIIYLLSGFWVVQRIWSDERRNDKIAAPERRFGQRLFPVYVRNSTITGAALASALGVVAATEPAYTGLHGDFVFQDTLSDRMVWGALVGLFAAPVLAVAVLPIWAVLHFRHRDHAIRK